MSWVGSRLKFVAVAVSIALAGLSAGISGSALAETNAAGRGPVHSTRAGSRIAPFKSTAAGDLYRIAQPSQIVAVRLMGYGRHAISIPVSALRRHLRRGVLAITVGGRLAQEQRVARARKVRLRHHRWLVMTMRAAGVGTSGGAHAAGANGSGGGGGGVSGGGSNPCAPPYAGNSPWNTPISASPAVDPQSAAEVATLGTNTSYPMIGSDPTQWTYPVYNAAPSTPTLPVYVASIWSDVTGPGSLNRTSGGRELQIPIPAGAQPSGGGDQEVIVVNRATGDEWGFWEFYNSSDTLVAPVLPGTGTVTAPLTVQNARADYFQGQQIVIGQGTPNAETAVIASFPDASHMILTAPASRTHNAGDRVWAMGASNGYHYNTMWSGVPPSGFASRGAGVPYLAGLIRPCEIAQGHIDHALAFAYQNTTSQFVSPATKSDGGATLGMPEGTHLQLDPSIPDSTIQGWGCTGACFTAAKAMQRYGMYLIDTAGHPKLYFEDDNTAHWGNTVTASTMNAIPLSDLRVIDG